MELNSFAPAGLAVVVGSKGGVGSALHHVLGQASCFERVIGLSRLDDGFEMTNEETIAAAAASISSIGFPVRLVIVATGVLHDARMQPEKSWRQLGADQLLRSFAINAVGPALVAKHFLPLLPRQGKSVFAALSAKVGSIGDNHLGGWYGYRAAKAALNQLTRTASIELRRTHPDAICTVIHPGTVATALSAPYRSAGHEPVEPTLAAERLLGVINSLRPIDSGLFFDHSGVQLAW